MKAKLKKLPKIRKPTSYLLWCFYQGAVRILESAYPAHTKVDHFQCIATCVNNSLVKPKRKKE